ncbi:4Fe-4S dicluster domain-containing protein [Alicyclobacillaceae bacterium I2511]|nr:4Fe-4S dicluster domain-containing protein [Alicyclobacillaceae bacterium I2511]
MTVSSELKTVAVRHQNNAEIRLESIGGLGANLAGKMLAEAGVLRMGLNGWNAASYGSEKKGTPVKSYVRLTPPDVQIRGANPIEEPDVVGVFHEALFKTQNCIAGLKTDGILVVNTTKTPEQIRKESGLHTGTVVCVDAMGISVEEKTRVNTAMLGALCRVVPILDPDKVRDVIRDTFQGKYPGLTEANIRTFDRGYAEVTVQEFPPEAGEIPQPFVRPVSDFGYQTQNPGGIINTAGNSVLKDMSASRQGFLPDLNLAECIHCGNCDQVCPDMCFVWEPKENEKGRTFMFLQGIDYQYCKGCLKCVDVCPTSALTQLREEDLYAEEHSVKHDFPIIVG